MNPSTSFSSSEISRSRLRPLNDPVMHFDLNKLAASLREENAWRDHGQSALTLIKHEDGRVVLIVLKAGCRIKQHSSTQHLTIQTLTGNLRLHLVGRQTVGLATGQLLCLDRGVAHDVEAVEDSSFLVSLGWSRT